MLVKIKAKEKRTAEDEMVRQLYQLSGYEFEQTLGDSGGKSYLLYYRLSKDDLATTQQQQAFLMYFCPPQQLFNFFCKCNIFLFLTKSSGALFSPLKIL